MNPNVITPKYQIPVFLNCYQCRLFHKNSPPKRDRYGLLHDLELKARGNGDGSTSFIQWETAMKANGMNLLILSRKPIIRFKGWRPFIYFTTILYYDTARLGNISTNLRGGDLLKLRYRSSHIL